MASAAGPSTQANSHANYQRGLHPKPQARNASPEHHRRRYGAEAKGACNCRFRARDSSAQTFFAVGKGFIPPTRIAAGAQCRADAQQRYIRCAASRQPLISGNASRGLCHQQPRATETLRPGQRQRFKAAFVCASAAAGIQQGGGDDLIGSSSGTKDTESAAHDERQTGERGSAPPLCFNFPA